MRRRIFSQSLRSLLRFRLRSSLMLLGVAVGVAALTLVLSLAEGTEKKVMDEIGRMFTANNIVIRAGGAELMSGHRGGPTETLTPADLQALEDEIEAIEAWDALQMIPSREVASREGQDEVRIFGLTPRSKAMTGRGVREGTFFDDDEMERSARVALLGIRVAASLFGDGRAVGEQIRIGGVPFEVIGVLEERGTDLHGLDRDDEIYVPLTTLMRRLANVDHVLFGKVNVADPDRMEETAARIATLLRERHAIGSGEKDDFSLITPIEVRRMVARSNRVFDRVLPLVAGVALLVVAVVIANLLLASVAERRAEIGLRLAVGARRRDIVGQVVVEALLVTLAGGGLGILLGLWGGGRIALHLELPSVLSPTAIGLGVLASVMVGLLAAWLPARRAAAVNPIVALR